MRTYLAPKAMTRFKWSPQGKGGLSVLTPLQGVSVLYMQFGWQMELWKDVTSKTVSIPLHRPQNDPRLPTDSRGVITSWKLMGLWRFRKGQSAREFEVDGGPPPAKTPTDTLSQVGVCVWAIEIRWLWILIPNLRGANPPAILMLQNIVFVHKKDTRCAPRL